MLEKISSIVDDASLRITLDGKRVSMHRWMHPQGPGSFPKLGDEEDWCCVLVVDFSESVPREIYGRISSIGLYKALLIKEVLYGRPVVLP